MVSFIDRHQGGERAILVHIDLRQRFSNEALQEFHELVHAANVLPLHTLRGSRDKPSPHAFIGRGKLQELKDLVEEHHADVVIFNHSLTPAQARNLEQACCCKVIDRTELILDIFASRARTFEGRLQVELAQLQHMSTRLVRGWTHLERQRGGIGLRGPGETQLETDRRLLLVRMRTIGRALQKVRARRQRARHRRKRSATPTVVLVGYTNAGKSTLFNALVKADVYADDRLFATLDPTYRELELSGVGAVMLVDTVGFIRHLPHHLVDAFKATLEEVKMAQLLCHVVDVNHPEKQQVMQNVQEVLQQLGAEDVPQLIVYNKIDQQQNKPSSLANKEDKDETEIDSKDEAEIDSKDEAEIDSGVSAELSHQDAGVDHAATEGATDDEGIPYASVRISAKSGAGLEELCQLIARQIAGEWVQENLTLAYSQGAVRAWLYARDAILEEREDAQGQCWQLRIALSKESYARLQGML